MSAPFLLEQSEVKHRNSISSFTPGPWEADFCGRGGFTIEAPTAGYSGGTLVICARNPHTPRIAEMEANARLIAASPVMYSYIKQRAATGDEEAARILESIHA